jgi:uncharacterized protein (UPF0261 family)
MPVVLVGTLDTKGVEFQFVREILCDRGLETLVIDAGVAGPPHFAPDVPREHVFEAAGTTLAAIQKASDRGQAVEAAARGMAKLVADLHREGKVHAILGLGGSAGTTIGTAAMRALPFGVPKVMVSTLASGQVKPYVGVRDILMMNSVVDISGLNRISRTVLANAANAIAGMLTGIPAGWLRDNEVQKCNQCGRPMGRRMSKFGPFLTCSAYPECKNVVKVGSLELSVAQGKTGTADKSLITATMFGVTTPCVGAAQKQLEAGGYEVLVFHATGVGGMTMESFVADGLIEGVLDITTTELADELVGGTLSAGRDRLTAAGMRGVPQVISLGALDMVNFGPPDTVPERFSSRRFYQHNPTVTLMRTTPEENDRLGKEIAQKASAARGPTAVLVPLRGVSAIDREGQPFWWPEADQALFQSLRNWIGPQAQLVELDLHINDPEFARVAAETLLRLMKN